MPQSSKPAPFDGWCPRAVTRNFRSVSQFNLPNSTFFVTCVDCPEAKNSLASFCRKSKVARHDWGNRDSISVISSSSLRYIFIVAVIYQFCLLGSQRSSQGCHMQSCKLLNYFLIKSMHINYSYQIPIWYVILLGKVENYVIFVKTQPCMAICSRTSCNWFPQTLRVKLELKFWGLDCSPAPSISDPNDSISERRRKKVGEGRGREKKRLCSF